MNRRIPTTFAVDFGPYAGRPAPNPGVSAHVLLKSLNLIHFPGKTVGKIRTFAANGAIGSCQLPWRPYAFPSTLDIVCIIE
jgi:hypothetical protein